MNGAPPWVLPYVNRFTDQGLSGVGSGMSQGSVGLAAGSYPHGGCLNCMVELAPLEYFRERGLWRRGIVAAVPLGEGVSLLFSSNASSPACRPLKPG